MMTESKDENPHGQLVDPPQHHSFAPDRMSIFEQQFSSSILEVVVPDASLEFPSPGANGDTWYNKLKADGGERNTAFFGKVPHSPMSLEHLR
jgi:hypothetical protein